MNRVAITGAVAVMLASLSLSSVIASAGWIATGGAAVAVVVIAGALTRLSRMPAAVASTFLVLIALVPLLTRPGWADRSAALLFLVITALSATGARPLRGFAVLACYLAALLLYLNVVFAHAASYGYLIPSDSSIRSLAQLWQAAFQEFRYAPPVPDLPAVSLVTAAGIGAVAIAVDILAVRLRRPAVAGLPLLLLFSVPVASDLKVFGAPQMVIFALGLAGYLALLSADGRERLRMWGRLVTFRHVQAADETGTAPDTRELGASGRRIGLAAICLAIIIPLILPSMRVRDVFATTADGSGHGGGSAAVSPLLSVQNLLEGKARPVLTYTTSAKDPGEQYFQVYAVNYSAKQRGWLQPSYGDTRQLQGPKLPWAAPGVLPTTPVTKFTTTVTISQDDTGTAVLPMPYAPYQLSVRGSGWFETGESLMVFNPDINMPGLSYTVQSDETNPQPADIPNVEASGVIKEEYDGYKGPDEARLYDIAYDHTIRAGATTYLQEAQKLEDWFTSGAFSYTLKPDLPATNWLIPFLTADKRGFCSQFAQAFAILARTLGIPARIAIGYTGGTRGSGNTWDVTTADAHAWPELYFTGYGWLRFEPTPSGSGGQDTAEAPSYAGQPAASSQKGDLTPSSQSQRDTGSGKLGRGRLPTNRFAHAAYDSPAAHKTPPGSKKWLAVAVPVALFLLLAWPALTRLLTRRRRWLTASGDAGMARAAWRELTDDLADYGLDGTPGETPRAVARRVVIEARLDGTAAQAVRRLAAAEERARYSRLPDPAAGLKDAVLTVRRAVAASVPRRQRVAARLLPSSTLLAARRLAQRGSELLGWLDSSWPTVRRQLRHKTARRTA
ncbi:MAG TPA: transglutaminaseTgpA domain-containing protein [Streptosporangiaceae bacterium]|nr:transglutaminaseTgpA domain-containing protein [Streptosporangiaceae bacterium]